MNKLAFCLAVGLLFGSVATAGAESKAGTVTVTPFLGGYTFDGEQHLKTRPVYGIRAGYNFTERFGTEAVFDYVRTEGTHSDADYNVYNYHLDLLYHFFPSYRAVPFLMAGIGGVTFDGPGRDIDRLAYNYGLGVKFALTDKVQLRGEVRHLLHHYNEETYNNLEYGIGLGFVFGGAEPAPKAAAVVEEAKPAPVVAPAPAPTPAPPAAPTGSISVAPAQAMQGTAATVSWECLNAQGAEIQPGIGQVATRGSRSVSPTDSTEYTLTCTGPGGQATSSSTLTVTPPPRPACTMTAVPETITEGQASRLDWDCTNAQSAEIRPELGQVDARGSRSVTPGETTTYTVTGAGAGTTASASSTVTVNPLPPEKRSIALDVQFDTGKAEVKPAYHNEIGRVAAFLKEYPSVTGTIEGHTDNVGSHDKNVALSQRRADAVRDYLVSKFGIDPSRLKAVGYGPDRPIASNKTAEGRQKNRRTVATFETMVKRRR